MDRSYISYRAPFQQRDGCMTESYHIIVCREKRYVSEMVLCLIRPLQILVMVSPRN